LIPTSKEFIHLAKNGGVPKTSVAKTPVTAKYINPSKYFIYPAKNGGVPKTSVANHPMR
jgi:hypothetical protein